MMIKLLYPLYTSQTMPVAFLLAQLVHIQMMCIHVGMSVCICIVIQFMPESMHASAKLCMEYYLSHGDNIWNSLTLTLPHYMVIQ